MSENRTDGDTGTTEGTGKEQQELNTADIKSLQDKLDGLQAELDKERKVKAEIVSKRDERNKQHSALKDEKTGLEGKLQELTDKFTELAANYEISSKELEESRSYIEREKASKKEQLDLLTAEIPEEKRALLDDAIPEDKVEKRLEYIRKHSEFLLGKDKKEVSAFYVHKPTVKEPKQTSLTEAEKAFIWSKNSKMPEHVAIELKKRDPDFFAKKMNKN